MSTILRTATTLVGVLFLAAPAFAQNAEPIGIWQTEAGDARIKVSKCGGNLCGVIVSIRDKIDRKTGKPAVDDKNPNPALQNRPMVGVSLFSGMRPVGPNQWSGKIYNADDGNTYTSNVSVKSADQLRVEGCVGPICGGETWTRVGR